MKLCHHSRVSRQGFTLIDVLIALLVLTLGLLSAIALTMSGVRESAQAIGMATAQSTARSALNDPSLVDAAKGFNDTEVSGFFNGYYVKRKILQKNVSDGIDLVEVRVFWGDSGQELAGLVSMAISR